MICLFLDDERMPGDVTWVRLHNASWEIVRSHAEAVAWVEANGCPDVISFDHDLGMGGSGYTFAKWLVDADLDGRITIPHHFEFTVHSMNPIGARNIQKYLDSYIAGKSDKGAK